VALGLQFTVDGLGRAGELDEPLSFDGGVAVEGLLGFGEPFVDFAQVRRARSWRNWK